MDVRDKTAAAEAVARRQDSPVRDLVIVGLIALALGVVFGLCQAALGGDAGGVEAAGSHSVEYSPDDITQISNTSEGVAATVNGDVIGEHAVTAYIQVFRRTQGLGSDEAWAQWLSDNDYDAEQVRSDTIDYLVSQLLVRQAAEQLGVQVNEEQVDEAVSSARASVGNDEAWVSALESQGLSEDLYRQQVRDTLLQWEVLDVVAGDVTADAEDVLAQVQMYVSAYNGAKRSSFIRFETSNSETASMVLEQINSGELSFEEAASQYSTDDSSDAGWDKMSSMGEAYQEVLDGLDVGQVGGPALTDSGIYLVKCVDILNAPDQVDSLDQVSSGFVDTVRELMDSTLQMQAFSNWMNDFKAAADIQVSDMPEGIPYSIDVEAVLAAASAQDGAANTNGSAQEAKTGLSASSDSDEDAAAAGTIEAGEGE